MIEDSPVTPGHIPVGLRQPQERRAHISKRMFERAGIVWSVDQVAALEGKIRLVRGMVNEGKQPVAILPTKIGESADGKVHYYRVLIQNKPSTFVWSQLAKCLITYAGPGELPNGIEAETPQEVAP